MRQIQTEIGAHKKAGVLDLSWGNALVTPTEVHLLLPPRLLGMSVLLGGGGGRLQKQSKREPRRARLYLSVRVLMVLVVAGVVILLDEAKVFLPLPLQDALSPLRIRREVTLRGGNTRCDWKNTRTRGSSSCSIQISLHFPCSMFY